ncbi:MAG: DNA gyrase subunit A [Proteobacteria bacterium]|nr:DNA gyrase subunit A [Pseudomonadota bacterium]MDA1057334.1 DNA gyrase subunit A [Pseudomonadota bacterium]
MPSGVTPVTIEEEMKRSYLDYAMSVIVSRALPDARDGLKPVHRRILHAMNESGFDFNKPYRKSARIVGDVMGKYHPHGDQAIYDAMVRMAQDFSMRLPLLDGQGNFGSMDGDPAAAMRYTEIRMAESAHALLADIDKNTVDFQDNYDGSASEPLVLPARFPNLLVNGAGGIAVGMATNIPPHNLGEVIDACCAYVDDPEVTVDTLMGFVAGPDFPTGGIIMGRQGLREGLRVGRGSVVIRSKVHFEDAQRERTAIVVTEIPYQVNKSHLVEQIADVAREKRVEGIVDLRDESDRDGVRVVIEISRNVNPEVVVNQLYRFTRLQTSFGVNMLALSGGRPGVMNLRDLVEAFVNFREEVIARRTKFELGKARDRAHVLVGLAIAVANIDEVIAMIRGAKDPAAARTALTGRVWPAEEVADLIALIDEPGRRVEDGVYRLSEEQARAILDLRLQRLTALGRDEIGDELKQLAEKILDFLGILRSRERLMGILRAELVEMKEKFATPRRTVIEESFVEYDEEDLIQREDMVVTVSHAGYIKRVPVSTYRTQRRGGKGRSGMSTREEDFVTQVSVVNTHTPLLFFSSRGKVYKLKTYRLPLGTPQARGRPMVHLLPLAEGETIATILPLPEDETTWSDLVAVFATAEGLVRPISLSKFDNILSTGIIAIKLKEGDRLVGVSLAADDDDILLVARGGKCIRFAMQAVRLMGGRATAGVRGMALKSKDEVISMSVLRHMDADADDRQAYLQAVAARRRLNVSDYEGKDSDHARDAEVAARLDDPAFAAMSEGEQFILSLTENGYGKRSSAYEYRVTNRGGSGIINIETSERNGPVVASFPVADGDDIMLVTDGGKLIRTPVGDIRIAGRNTQGVIAFKTGAGEKVVSAARLGEDDDGDAEDQAGQDVVDSESAGETSPDALPDQE